MNIFQLLKRSWADNALGYNIGPIKVFLKLKRKCHFTFHFLRKKSPIKNKKKIGRWKTIWNNYDEWIESTIERDWKTNCLIQSRKNIFILLQIKIKLFCVSFPIPHHLPALFFPLLFPFLWNLSLVGFSLDPHIRYTRLNFLKFLLFLICFNAITIQFLIY